jgi:hypothetical protein
VVEKPGEAGTVTNCTVSKGAELGLAAGDRADGAAGAQVNMTYNFSATQNNGRIGLRCGLSRGRLAALVCGRTKRRRHAGPLSALKSIMPLTLTLDNHGEELVSAYLRSGLYHSPEEVVARALETLAASEPHTVSAATMSPDEAVADIRELRKGITLGGLRIKNLVNEGRKY